MSRRFIVPGGAPFPACRNGGGRRGSPRDAEEGDPREAEELVEAQERGLGAAAGVAAAARAPSQGPLPPARAAVACDGFWTA